MWKKILLFLLVAIAVFFAVAVKEVKESEARRNTPTAWFETCNSSESIQVEVLKYPTFLVGSNKIDFLVNSVLVYQTEIANNGGTLTEEHFSLLWSGDDKLDVVLKGREQHDEHIEFRFEDGQVWVNGLLVE